MPLTKEQEIQLYGMTFEDIESHMASSRRMSRYPEREELMQAASLLSDIQEEDEMLDQTPELIERRRRKLNLAKHFIFSIYSPDRR